MNVRSVIVALAVLAVASPAVAQQASQPVPMISSMVAINPLGIPFAIASLEYAGSIGGGAALGVDVSYVGPGSSQDQRWSTAEVKARYYPSEVVFDGFSVGLTAGVTNFSNSIGDASTVGGSSTHRESVTLPALGVTLDYDWLIGAHDRFLVGTGIGAKRLFGDIGELKHLDGPVAYPTARIVIGLLF